MVIIFTPRNEVAKGFCLRLSVLKFRMPSPKAERSVSHLPTLQKRKYASLAGAIKDLTVDSIVRSWDATGIPPALWGDVPSIKPMFVGLKKLHPEERQHAL